MSASWVRVFVAAVARSKCTHNPVHFGADAGFEAVFQDDVAVDGGGIERAVELTRAVVRHGMSPTDLSPTDAVTSRGRRSTGSASRISSLPTTPSSRKRRAAGITRD